ncbi:MAG: Gfo/Idh/MocA family oxidoreductase [Kiritimatiellae bacterium]|nr:Gfo/Idh/MocA family oxidoreductase [Kiritimatiellia bacterium]
MSDVRIGVAGVGNMGGCHGTTLAEGKVPGAVLAAICDRDSARFETFPDVPSFATHAEMIASGLIDAVLVATPHYDHVPIGIDTLNAGLHLLVEKPLAVTKLQATQLIAASEANPNCVFSAMFNQRTDARYTALKRMIDNGELGKINRINWIITDWFRTEIYYAGGDWRATWSGEGGGVLMNQCPHQIDLWQWLFGMPDKVRTFAQFGRFHNIEVEDDVTAYFEYANGATGVFITTTGEAPGTNRLEISAENGKVIVEGKGLTFLRNETPSTEFIKTSDKAFGTPKNEAVQITLDEPGEQHLGIMKNFVAAIRGDAKLIAPGEEGIHMVELANAMLYSSLHDMTVTLPLDAEVYEKHLQKLVAESTFEKQTASTKGSVDMSDSF